MSKVPRNLSGNKIKKTLVSKFGFKEKSQKGDHLKLISNSNPVRIVIVPLHKQVKVGTFQSILRQADISLEDFLKNIK